MDQLNKPFSIAKGFFYSINFVETTLMINFERLEREKDALREQFLNAPLFPHISIDNFCDSKKIEVLYESIPNIDTKSADYAFAKNKFEKSKIKDISPEFEALYKDFISDRFQKILQYITNEELFVDDSFYGGGIHQGKKGSFLNMHADFNYHPLNKKWFRNLNILLYLNKDWKPEYGGQLKLEDKRSGEKTEVGVPFNRLTIMHSRAYTLHGYDPINFPDGTFRTSIAAYAFSLHEAQQEAARTTEWKIDPKKDGYLKYILSKMWVPAVKLKSKFTKSSTAKH